MKSLYAFCLLITFSTFSYAQDVTASTETTHFYLIRHAEKDKSNPENRNPHLTEKGQERALKWREIFKHIEFDAVYSTQYHRTIETATPTAKANNLDIQFYDPRKLYSEAFKSATQGKTVLIVGHSNTTPAFVNAIIGQDKYKSIDESNNGNLYIISINDATIIDKVLTIN
ncbi:phosphoglycerate mutase family protein [Psychroserpens sp.]|uniref:phosphoglycerate mutase family protein n=1 Tax=Psychroserpens sp. TaxID=2020870 RepID=UPI001B20C9B0|nr:phosphoglycerate mutase family protein [Psychroserpens sp.]MBO6606774.1 histidine phosphatase family protein [Psychroserpens sp.]MBO6632924.1 histidine phosphatase family protein [Psychroserpens sp.]MBO6653477.1 histidine phosphatase family protein [Psychroserpens sp.]MBO6680495.1 histidine phosphatase family protein [Psychroserpens sp.]MBO6750546.1 histidine phosphatase family protein [Psychroserpens sp.]